MKTKAKVCFGVAALVAVGMVGFAPASADKGSRVASVEVKMAAVVLASPETPQDSVWDMTYGVERAGTVEESVASLDETIVDYTFG
jgi:hypothetical protein